VLAFLSRVSSSRPRLSRFRLECPKGKRDGNIIISYRNKGAAPSRLLSSNAPSRAP
jgi:hypothetical protein